MIRVFSRRRTLKVPRLQIFVSDLGATGVVRNAIAIANRAATSGYDVRLLTCDASGVLHREVSAQVEIVELLGDRHSRPRTGQLQRALSNYRRRTREWRPDILMSAGNHGHLLSTIAWLGLPGRKLLRLSNDLDQARRPSSRMRRIVRMMKFHTMASLADRLVFVSRPLHDHPSMARYVRAGKAELIANGVDVEQVRQQAGEPCLHTWLADQKVPTVVAVGRPVPQKNFDTLIKAFARAAEVRDLRLVIVGGGQQADIRALARLAEELGIRGRVDFVNAVPNPFSYMAAADTLALPSLWEGSPNVLLEAMACGTPVIASTTAGNAPDILGHGEFGLLVEPMDERGLAEAILRQTDALPVGPGKRVSAFSREQALLSYIQLFDRMSGRTDDAGGEKSDAGIADTMRAAAA
jgi:glycosyltransferase involved in cell wall biosynthesis